MNAETIDQGKRASSEENETDVQLMLRLKAGDDLALNELMSRWKTSLTAFIYRYIGREEDAVDQAQETFVRVFESRHRYEPTAKFSTWIFSIAANLCRNYLRWQQRHPTVPTVFEDASGETHDLIDETASKEASPADHAQRNDLACAVREHVQALPHDLKTAVLLFEYEEMSHEEIARVLGCSPKAIETRLYRARKILRDALSRNDSVGICLSRRDIGI